VLRLQEEGQRREVAEAVRWLDDEDRQLLSLWWLEVAGELTRRELAAAVGISRQHAAVRVQRMKQRLEIARDIVRALDGHHPGAGNSPCPDLRLVTARWDGRPDSVWRKRLARHIRGCAYCSGAREAVVPAERLLVGIALVPLPVGFTLSLAFGGKTAVAATSVGWSAKVLGLLTKPAVAVTAGATLAAGGLYVVTRAPDDPPPALAAPTAASTARPPSGRTGAPSASATPSPSPSASPSPSPSPSKTRVQLYGTVVDAVDSAPAPNALPAALPRRAEKGVTATGAPATGLTHRGETVTLSGQGYFRVRWQVLPQQRTGALLMPTWTGLSGKLFHVASGGGHRMDDVQSGSTDGTTWMGGPSVGYAALPSGTQQMWQNEYFWIDGTVTLHQNEGPADYNLFVQTSTWDKVTEDVRTGPAQGVIRYGLVRDNGEDTAPVPQYLTRSTPADPATVSPRSQVTS
ncbi:sigma-70 family RNA polymerase sigma factor, partial [Streptomyces sp. NPDC057927]